MLPPANLYNHKKYKQYLVQFMSFCDGVAYTHDYAFTNEQLSTIQTEELAKWFAMKVFGVWNPGTDDNPTLRCLSSLKQYKKAI